MPKHTRVMLCLGVASMLAMAAPAARAQFEEEHDEGEVLFDTTIGPLIMPAADDFVPVAGEEETAGGGEKARGGAGVNTYVDVTEHMKAGVLTPYDRFARALALEAHVPLIWDRTFTYFGSEVSDSGLGDVTLDAEYTRRLSAPGSLLRFTGSVKLPTGDEENQVEDEFGVLQPVPLGTGTTDFIAKGQYARSTPKQGLVFALMYRRNSPYETSQDNGVNIQTTKTYAGDQIVASAFGRTRASRSVWLHLGASVMKLGSGKTEITNSDGTPGWEADLEQGGTLVDVFPGISYALGRFNPYFGLRIPFSTSFDNDFRYDKRDTALIFQFSYQPEGLLR